MNELENARKIINETDAEMARLFEKRMDAVSQIAQYKKQHGVPVEDLLREKKLTEKNSERILNEDYKSYYVSFLKTQMDLSKKYQHKIMDGMKVAYSGVEGAFANIAAKKIFPDAKCVPSSDFRSAYEKVENGECDCALLPLENSFNGDVGTVMDLAFFGSLYVTGVYETQITQNLLAIKGTDIKDIKEVISHPQALGQCMPYIEEHGFKTIEAVNTAVAAKQVSDLKRHDIAAIGSEEAAEKFGLVKLESHINKNNNNTTRFAVFSRAKRTYSSNDNHFIILFTVKNVAGSLGEAISVIGNHGFNLKAIKSRPTKELVWDYYFFVEGEGNIAGEDGKEMLLELNKCCSNLKILGSFENEVKI